MHALKLSLMAAGFLALAAQPAIAQDEDAELWFNPAFVKTIDDRTSVELETAQRLRADPRLDTYFARLWLNREDGKGREWSFGVEQRWNGPDEQEMRLLQQVGYDWGPVEFRTRLEQRFVDVDPQTGWRLRQRIGTTIPLSDGEDGWAVTGDVELFVTLRNTEPGGQTGVTGLRTFVGFERSFGRYDLSVGYLRQQDIRDGVEDRVGHAPFLGLTVNF
ncbi:DUF2490 domain-containing protein [Brevundimonas fluminis]|uniref:DUF2490 domain-containing protein n=1 Tax=Brevundimonas fluminis TaxID=2487274 RepID=UPI000F657E64|nr:DUF2490 domain-containing protein [Brevundimonas fluminis]